MKNIRNFCIIAHIDHGKSTLADRLLEYTNTVGGKDLQNQVLDDMDLERERGITIKSHAIQMKYVHNGEEYTLNLIDTPGHVDFSYEVSRSIAACEGALLIVDATQGVQAQTLANFYLAFENNLEVLPVINKMDLPSARPEEAKRDIENIIGIPADQAPCISAKTGLNIKDVLDQIVDQIPPPKGDDEAPLQALIFDSYYDNYKGAVCLVRIMNGSVKTGSKIKMIQTGKEFEVVEVGVFKPKIERTEILKAGDVGYISASIKTVSDISVGDTITEIDRQSEALPGYRKIQPVVYSGIFPIDGEKYNAL